MRSILSVLLSVLSLSAFATSVETGELTKLSKEHVSVRLSGLNPDNSVTFIGIKLLRGDMAYEIDASRTNATHLCKMLGYDAHLFGTGLVEFDTSRLIKWTLASLDEEGNFVDTLPSLMKFSKVTCVYPNTHKTVIRGDKYVNLDKSTTIRNIMLSRGDMEYALDGKNTTFDSACKLFGFQKSLHGTGLNTIELDATLKFAAFDTDGAFIDTALSISKITKLTCK